MTACSRFFSFLSVRLLSCATRQWNNAPLFLGTYSVRGLGLSITDLSLSLQTQVYEAANNKIFPTTMDDTTMDGPIETSNKLGKNLSSGYKVGASSFLFPVRTLTITRPLPWQMIFPRGDYRKQLSSGPQLSNTQFSVSTARKGTWPA